MQRGEVALGVQQEEVVPEVQLGEVPLSVDRAVADKEPAGEAQAGRAARRRRAKLSVVSDTDGRDGAGVLRIDFPGYGGTSDSADRPPRC